MLAIRDFLQQRLAAGEWRIGQVLVRPDLTLRHQDDAARSDLKILSRPEDAREVAKYDDAENYRPLKTAPNLRHGWQLNLSKIEELHLALDFLYPAALGTLISWSRGELLVVPFRETLARQSGMYRVTQLITDDQAAGVIRQTCVDGCLRERLWDPDAEVENSNVLCAEACNLLVAACRPVAKGNQPKTEGQP